LSADHLQIGRGNHHLAVFLGDVAGELHLVAHVTHELRVFVRGEIASHGVDFTVRGEERDWLASLCTSDGTVLRVALGHLMVDACVRLVHLVAGLVDELARDGLRRCKRWRTDGDDERGNNHSCT
jgi:hypothetical protein